MSGYESINKLADPRATRQAGSWRCTVSGPVDGHYTYTPDAETGNVGAIVIGGSKSVTRGLVLFAHVRCTALNRIVFESNTQTWYGTDWVASRIEDNPVGNTNLYLHAGSGPVTLLHAGMYTPDDWEHLYALYQAGRISIPWCAGPRDAAAGVLGPWQL